MMEWNVKKDCNFNMAKIWYELIQHIFVKEAKIIGNEDLTNYEVKAISFFSVIIWTEIDEFIKSRYKFILDCSGVENKDQCFE